MFQMLKGLCSLMVMRVHHEHTCIVKKKWWCLNRNGLFERLNIACALKVLELLLIMCISSQHCLKIDLIRKVDIYLILLLTYVTVASVNKLLWLHSFCCWVDQGSTRLYENLFSPAHCTFSIHLRNISLDTVSISTAGNSQSLRGGIC